MITQINTLLDSVIAWGLAADPDGSATATLFGVAYPMQAGAAAAIYYGERFYQLPLGILGLAIATAVFPLLSRHAAKGNHEALGADLTVALRIVLFTSVPAGVGLVLLARPLAELTYQHGTFTVEDAARTAGIIAAYATAVWAFCAAPVVIRGFYAHGDQRTPMRLGLVVMIINVLLDFTLIWPLAEFGLALSTALAAIVQLILLLAVFHFRYRSLEWSTLLASTARTIMATAVMGIAVVGVWEFLPEASTWTARAFCLITTIFGGAAVFGVAARMLGASEMSLLFSRTSPTDTSVMA
jgi:putative peptidoglycan lipid II flippase